MDNEKYILARNAVLSIAVSDVDKIISGGDGDCALLFLQILKNGGVLSSQLAESELGFTKQRLSEAVRGLDKLGLLLKSTGKLSPAPELPEYNAEEISIRSAQAPGFKAVVSETQRIFGRMLSGAELKTIFAVYDYLSLPAEVILLLINYCVDEYRERFGDGRLPTLRSIEKEAYIWADREILTLEQAEEYIRRKHERKDIAAQVAELLQIRGRELTKTEKQYIDSWIEMGFLPDAIEIAYDKTVVKTGKLTWKYMDSILSSWHSKGLHTPDVIESGDKLPGDRQHRAGSQPQPPDKQMPKGELERMKKLLEQVKKG